MNINNTDFPVSITNKFKKIEKEYNEKKEFLKFHQHITKEYIAESLPDFRGLLVYYTTGQGKTFLATSVAEYYRNLNKDRKIVVLSAKSLRANFYDATVRYMMEVEKMTKTEAEKKIQEDYRFVSSNASNMIQQLKSIKKEVKDDTKILPLDKKIESIVSMHKRNGFLENSLIIVDEAHNIFNSIVNGSKLALEFYDIILNTKDVKLMFLSGTPVVNSPFELVPCFNMLFGYKFFPEVREDFENWFIDVGRKDIKNKGKFTNYLVGRVSYFGTKYFSVTGSQKGFPIELPINVEEVPMSIYQFSVYNNARVLEKKEEARKFGTTPSRFGTGQASTSGTYRVKTRQISNFAFPEGIRKNCNQKMAELQSMKDKKEAQKIRRSLKKKMVEELSNDNLNMQGLKVYSPKMLAIVDTINKEIMNGKKLGMVYSEFVTGEGIMIFSRVLKTLGWNEFSISEYIKHGGYIDNDDIYENTLDMYDPNSRKSGGKKKKSLLRKGTNFDSVEFANLPKARFTQKEKSEKSPFSEKGRISTLSNSQTCRRQDLPKKKKTAKPEARTRFDKSLEKSEKTAKQASTRREKGNYTFAIISGNVPPEERTMIIKALNSPKNIRGEIINILLLSSTGAEGLDLKGMRFIHIMDPYWNISRLNQIKARGIRFASHEHLNVNERNVQVYIYLSSYPKGTSDVRIKEEPTTDNYLYGRALENQVMIDKFLKVLIESSIDCSIHKHKAPSSQNFHCKICKPNNRQLYYKNLREDLDTANQCVELENDDISNLAEQVTAKELVLEGGKKVYYTVDKPGDEKNILSRIHVYEYRSALEGYTELPSDSVYYPQILEKIMQIIS